MINVNLAKLNAKDKMLIAKAVADIATTIYKSNNNFILNQIIANGTYDSKYGQFYKTHKNAKTIQEVIDAKYAQIEKLQNEIATLGTIADKSILIYTEATDTLCSKHYAEADSIAEDLLKDLYEDLGYSRLSKSASAISSKSK